MVTVEELSSDHAEELSGLYHDHPGWADREVAAVRRALEHTSLAIGLRDGNRLVAAARLLTDFVYYAKVYDVIVAADRRGEGLGRRLMAEIAAQPALSEMAYDHLELVCREGLVPFYESCGFERFDATVEVDGRKEEYVKMNYAFE
jgi:predicted GNAT family N-acyltransferase